MKNATLSENAKSQINYKEYPECMFAMIAAYLPPEEGHDIRKAAGKVVFRHSDKEGRTYKNGVLHSYEDKPAVIDVYFKNWCKNGKLHREGDFPAIIDGENYKVWYKNGYVYREANLPAFINGNLMWYINGEKIHRQEL